jgi:hypothetical protein
MTPPMSCRACLMDLDIDLAQKLLDLGDLGLVVRVLLGQVLAQLVEPDVVEAAAQLHYERYENRPPQPFGLRLALHAHRAPVEHHEGGQQQDQEHADRPSGKRVIDTPHVIPFLAPRALPPDTARCCNNAAGCPVPLLRYWSMDT